MKTIKLNQQQILAISLLIQEARELDYFNENNELKLFYPKFSGSDIQDLENKLNKLLE